MGDIQEGPKGVGVPPTTPRSRDSPAEVPDRASGAQETRLDAGQVVNALGSVSQAQAPATAPGS
jgi:hypothetical protein